MILSGLLIGFAALASIVFGFVAYVIVSSQQTDRYLLSIAGQDRALLRLAADVSPAEWEQAFLAVGRGGRWLTRPALVARCGHICGQAWVRDSVAKP